MRGPFVLHHTPYYYADNEELMGKIAAEHPGARFVEEIACCKSKAGNWLEFPGLLFYQENPPDPAYPKFFAYQRVVDTYRGLQDDGTFFYKTLRVGLPNFDPNINAIFVRNPETDGGWIVISRFGHDFVRAPLGNQFIDGGRDYIRTGGDPLPLVVPYNILTRTFRLNNEEYHVE